MKSKIVKVRAPGRINIIGEHTDYNGGFVLPAAIDKCQHLTLRLNGTNTINVGDVAVGDSFSFDLMNFERSDTRLWSNYLMGVVSELQKRGHSLEGFDAEFNGTVPIGAGMSSSAALECSFAFGLNELFDLGLSRQDLARMCQMSGHNFVGIKCGIMDQFTSLLGKKDHAIFLNCGDLSFDHVPIDLMDCSWVLLNTNVSHTLAASAYNDRVEECQSGVELLKRHFEQINGLSDVSVEDVNKYKTEFDDLIFKRCHHVVSENQRVVNAVEAMRNGKLETLGKLMYESHHSLSDDYQVSCEELDFLVDRTKDDAAVLGSRMMGGGFGGCTINLVRSSYVDRFVENMSRAYRAKFEIDLTPYQVIIEDGASVSS